MVAWFQLIDDDGNMIGKPNKTGELWVKGENFFKVSKLILQLITKNYVIIDQ